MINFSDFHTKKDWQNIDVNSINRNQSHTRWGAWDSIDGALLGEYGTSPYIKSLNGVYRFKLYDNPESADEFFAPDFDDSGFSDITVPGNWEVQGFGEPIYTNVLYPWNHSTSEDYSIQASAAEKPVYNPPYIPSANPTGCYRSRFTVPENFDGRDVFITFDGVETVYYLWINGKPVGYSQDSKLPGEFNITGFLEPGENQLAVMVIRFADTSYVEDQDYWHISGIFRSVWLTSKPKQRIEDYKITAIPDVKMKTGVLTVDVSVSRTKYFADNKVKVSLFTKEEKKIAEGTGNIMATAEYRADAAATANSAKIVLEVDDIKLWDPENPTLYTVVVTLLDPDGKTLDIESCKTGFKLIEIKNGIVELNGKRLIVQGTNRHEHYWKTGRTVTRKHMLEEIKQMKRMNMNAVRTSHYPDMPEWYDLCDECGILVVCETNLETHGLAGMLTHDPAWSGVFLSRAVRMVQNYKNHVSIFSWSLGNESGTGANHAAMYGFIKEYDNTRLCQYEAGGPGKNISDIRGNMYAPVNEIVKMLCDPADDRPVILVEYLYQIRNSGGGMEHFVKLTKDYPRFQGGFTWDWQDKSLCGKTENGEDYFAYGGDFGESVVEDGTPPQGCPPFMTNNGLVLADLTWKPVAYEVKQAYCPVRIGKPTVYGWNIHLVEAEDEFVFDHFIDTTGCNDDKPQYSIIATLRENGIAIASETVAQPKTENFKFTIAHEKKPDRIYTIEFSIRQKGDTFYAEDGYELGLYQFPLNSIAGKTCDAKPESKPVKIDESGDVYTISGDGFNVTFDKKTGELKQLERNGTIYIRGGGLPSFNRPLTGLDAYINWGWVNVYAKTRAVSLSAPSTQILKSDEAVSLKFDYTLANEAPYNISCSVTYLISGTGKIDVNFNAYIDPSYKAILRAGLEFIIPQGFETLEYFGLGPVENYPDRKLSAYLAVHESTVEDMHFPFAPPAENGGHEDTRCIKIKNDDASIIFKSITPFHFDIHHNTINDYIDATHDHKLIRRPESYLHIDAMHAPIGSDMAWSTVLPPSGLNKTGSYNLTFEIIV